MPVTGEQKKIIAMVTAWPDVEIRPHRYGGLEFRLGKRELGHIHGDSLVDIPFPKSVRNEVVDAGQAEPHHILPESGWVSVFLRDSEDVENAMLLLDRSFGLASEQKQKQGAQKKQEDEGKEARKSRAG